MNIHFFHLQSSDCRYFHIPGYSTSPCQPQSSKAPWNHTHLRLYAWSEHVRASSRVSPLQEFYWWDKDIIQFLKKCCFHCSSCLILKLVFYWWFQNIQPDPALKKYPLVLFILATSVWFPAVDFRIPLLQQLFHWIPFHQQSDNTTVLQTWFVSILSETEMAQSRVSATGWGHHVHRGGAGGAAAVDCTKIHFIMTAFNYWFSVWTGTLIRLNIHYISGRINSNVITLKAFLMVFGQGIYSFLLCVWNNSVALW